jgi:hypothetical protein
MLLRTKQTGNIFAHHISLMSRIMIAHEVFIQGSSFEEGAQKVTCKCRLCTMLPSRPKLKPLTYKAVCRLSCGCTEDNECVCDVLPADSSTQIQDLSGTRAGMSGRHERYLPDLAGAFWYPPTQRLMRTLAALAHAKLLANYSHLCTPYNSNVRR